MPAEIFVAIPRSPRIAMMGPPPEPNRDEHPYVGTLQIHGIPIYVENAPGSIREGTDRNGQPWRVIMRHFYGEIPDTIAADGDPVDVFVGPNLQSDVAFILHQRHLFSSEHEPEGTYDEDKVMLGFSSLDAAMEAYAANFNQPIWRPGWTAMPVAELKARLEDGELEFGAAITKAQQRPPGAGWVAIGRSGGYKRGPKGKEEYWYPKKSKPSKVKPATTDERREIMKLSLERDPSRGAASIKPGEIIEVGGRDGRFKYVPDYSKHGEGRAWVQAINTGKMHLVRIETLVALRKPVAKKRARKPPPPPPPRGRQRTADATPDDWPTGPTEPPPPTDRPSGKAPRAAPWEHSTAKPGSALEKVENGSLMLRQFRGRHDKVSRWTIHIPDALKDQLTVELMGVFHQAARTIAKRMRIQEFVPGTTHRSSDYQEVLAGAMLGFVMATANYRGGQPFIPLAQDYAAAYAFQAARQIRTGVPFKDRDLRAVTAYAAAKQRARKAAQLVSGEEPSQSDIIKHWNLTKKMVFTGRGESLGNYVTRTRDKSSGKMVDRIVNQSSEQVPAGPWQVKGPDGKPLGKQYPGKKQLADKMEQLLAGNDVANDEWLQRPPSGVLPDHSDLAMSAGAALHLRKEIMGILGTMGKRGDALAMRFGMYVPEDEDPNALSAKSHGELQAMARDRNLPADGDHSALKRRILDWSATQDRPGTGGRPANAMEVADALNLFAVDKKGKPKSDASRKGAVRRFWQEGLRRFKNKASESNRNIADWMERWGTVAKIDQDPPPEREFKPLMPSHNELKSRFGTDERVAIYAASIRAGTSQAVAPQLELEAKGELPPAASEQLRKEYHAQMRKDAQEAFNRYKAVTVDPDKVHDIGPQTNAPGEGEWLYPDAVLSNYGRALIREESQE